MTDIIVTLPKSTGGLNHLEEKTHNLRNGGYAWWWVPRGIKELSTEDSVVIVCEGKIRGHFSVRWIVERLPFDVIVIEDNNGIWTMEEMTSEGNVTIKCVEGPISLDNPFSKDDIQMLYNEMDEWIRDEKKCIFFDKWYPSLRQPEHKSFQGYRYVRGDLNL